MPEENKPENQEDLEASNYFMTLKRNYELQRQPWEWKWKQAEAAVRNTDNLDTVYESRANVKTQAMKVKVRGIVSRIMRIMFNVLPIGRLEDTNVVGVNKNIVDLWNKYIFDYQLGKINFKNFYKIFTYSKTIKGTAVAKVTQEFEEKEFTFFDDQEPETIKVKDNTYFRPMLLEEFYSDVNHYDIDDSQACIHSTVVSMEELRANEKRTEEVEFELEDGTIEVEREEVGVYKNLDLITMPSDNVTDEQADYMQELGLNEGQTVALTKDLKENNKTGFVKIDECYGVYDLDGDGVSEEVVCTIANGFIVIRLEPTPFKHKKYVRPFIVGRNEIIPNCLYGSSNVVDGLNLLMELNASRAQATDAKTRSVANMWYVDETKNVSWDGVWRPNGKIRGQGQNGMIPLINPNLSNVSIQDSQIIARDLDELFGLSPVQEGTSDNRLIPSTVGGTRQLIAQNDIPLNDMIDTNIDTELKKFIEMLYERNVVFKDVDDLLVVWDEKDLQKAGITEETTMKELLFEFDVKILGNLELSNEVAHQQGWQAFIAWAMNVPPVAKRIDWQGLANKQLASFGIKDDAEGIWLDPEIVAEVDEEQAQSQQQQVQAGEQQRQQQRGEAREDATFATELSTEAKIVEMTSEAGIEATTGQKVQ